MRVINKTRDTVLAGNAKLAASFFKRIKGLLGKKELKRGEALVIKPCDSIHTFFMRFPIDAVFVDKKGRAVGLKSNIRPWRFSPVYWQASFVIELPAGTIIESMTKKMDEISLD
jgi:hypothetical protein